VEEATLGAVYSSSTWIPFGQSAWHNIPKDRELNIGGCGEPQIADVLCSGVCD